MIAGELNSQDNKLNFYKEITRIIGLGDLNRIYQEAMDLIMNLDQVDVSMIYIVDNVSNEAVLQSYKNLPEEYLKRARNISYPKGMTWKIIREGEVIKVDDVQKSEELGKAGRILGIRSTLGIPILLNKKCIGVIWFLSYKSNNFDDNLIELLEILGEQLANVISRIKKTEELNVKNTRLSTLSILSQVVNKTTNMELLIDSIRREIKEIDLIESFAVYLVEQDENKKNARLKIHNDSKRVLVENLLESENQNSVTWQCIYLGETIYLPFVKMMKIPMASMVRDMGAKSFISIPIKIDTDTIGTCNFVNYSKEYFTEGELDFLKALGSQIGLAIAKTKMFEEYFELSIKDQLSGLYNRRYFDEILKTSNEYSYSFKESLSLLLIDLDDFKNINDKYGHLFGDKVIKYVGNFLQDNIRSSDIAARYGGDEFAVVLQHTDYNQSKIIADKLTKGLNFVTIDDTDNNSLKMDVSIGAVTSKGDIKSSFELISKADKALYFAKESGKSRFFHYLDKSF